MSTVDDIVSLCESIGKIENCSKTGIFLDFKKAFDIVNHKILLEKLERYGIRGKTLALFENYLNDRFQCVEIDGKFSNFLKMSTGVPQGSVLGPLLFLVYINDLPKVVNNLNKLACFLFADDTSIVAKNYNMNDIRCSREELEEIGDWLLYNKLSVNFDKTEFMTVSHSRKLTCKMKPEILGVVLKEVNRLKYLGIFIDNQLKFKEHIKYVCNRLSKLCGILYCVKHYITSEQKLLFYTVFAKPIIQYGILAYGNVPKFTLDPILKIQNRFVRIIYNKRKFESISYLYDERLLTVHELFVYDLFKHYMKKAPEFFKNETAHYYTRYAKSNLIDIRRSDSKFKLDARLRKLHNLLQLWNVELDIDMYNKAQTRYKKNFNHNFCNTFISRNTQLVDEIFAVK